MSGRLKLWNAMAIAVASFILAGCDSSQSASRTLTRATTDTASAASDLASDEALQLWQTGEFNNFISTIEKIAVPRTAKLDLLRAEAFLGANRLADAEQVASELCDSRRSRQNEHSIVRAHRLRLIAQLRQRKPISGFEQVDSERMLDEALPVARFWQRELSDEPPYQISGESSSLTMQSTTVWSGLESYELDSIAVVANSQTMPIAFIDTGAQWTVLTTDAARQAGILPSDATFELTGFSRAVARPAVLRELALGSLVLHNVPVLIADTAPLSAAKAQMTIGLDVLYHVRTTIDSKYGAVTCSDATTARDELTETANGERWEIPIWNFSTMSLAEARFGDQSARVLVDTGNAVGTFVASRWADRVLPAVRTRRPPPTLWFKKRKFDLPAFELGGQRIEHWPVLDSLPSELAQLDMIDLVFGRDLYSGYRLTIDLQASRFVLDNGPLPPAPARKAVRSSVSEDAGSNL